MNFIDLDLDQRKEQRMNELLKMMLCRRSIRQYTEEHVSEEHLQSILQAGLLSASGRRLRPWELIVVRDRTMLKRLSECREGAAKMLAGADCAILVLGDREKSDTIIEDCSIVMANMHLMASSLGLGSCWIQGRLRNAPDCRTTEDYVRELLHFPERYQLEAILSIGVPAKAAPAYDLASLPYERVHYDQF